jgi:hypothetical protein
VGRRWLVVLGVLMLTLCAALVSFERDLVVTPIGLADLTAKRRGDTVFVSGRLSGSGAQITKTTVQNDGSNVLVRVYVGAISQNSRGDFVVAVPLRGRVTTITVGDGPATRTFGRVFGAPIRFRSRHTKDSVVTVWPSRGRPVPAGQ